jgi:hypothetical protein
MLRIPFFRFISCFVFALCVTAGFAFTYGTHQSNKARTLALELARQNFDQGKRLYEKLQGVAEAETWFQEVYPTRGASSGANVFLVSHSGDGQKGESFHWNPDAKTLDYFQPLLGSSEEGLRIVINLKQHAIFQASSRWVGDAFLGIFFLLSFLFLWFWFQKQASQKEAAQLRLGLRSWSNEASVTLIALGKTFQEMAHSAKELMQRNQVHHKEADASEEFYERVSETHQSLQKYLNGLRELESLEKRSS